MKDYRAVLDRRRKLRQNTDCEIDTLLDQIKAHPELRPYVSTMGNLELDSLEERVGQLAPDLRTNVRQSLVVLFFDGYNTRRAINDAEINEKAGDALAMATLDEIVKDVKSYDPVLKGSLDRRALIPLLRKLRAEHPELYAYAKEAAAQRYEPLREDFPPGEADTHQETFIAAFTAAVYAGFIVRHYIERLIYADPNGKP